MKQHITVEQLKELSEEGKEKLWVWWTPVTGDMAMNKKTNKWQLVGGHCLNLITARKYYIPLLSIGQMIEFLYDNRSFPDWDYLEFIQEDYAGFEGEWYIVPEKLCDELWEAVKKILNESK